MALDLDLANTSRVELEHVLLRCVELGHDDDAAAIRAELAGRVWQHDNPYAVWAEGYEAGLRDGSTVFDYDRTPNPYA